MKILATACTAAVGLVVGAVPAHADQYEFISALDSRGVPYSNMLDMIDVGKMTCGSLRRGTPVLGPAGVGAPITALGYSGLEAAIITLEATRNMCPDQLSKVVESARGGSPAPTVTPHPCNSASPPAGCADGSY